MKRLAFAVPGDLATPTGGYAYDRRIITELKQLGWNVDVVDLGEGFPRPDEKTMARAGAELAKISPSRPIVIDGLAFGVMADAAASLHERNPLVALVHHPLALETGLARADAARFRTSEQAALAFARRVIVTSAATARTVESEYNVPGDRITVARPGNDPAALARGSSDGIVRMLSVGSFVPRKGFDVLVAALATLADLPWRLSIAGDSERDPKTAAEIRTQIAAAGLAERISIHGAVSSERLAELHVQADLFVLASRFEGFGMAYAEAVAHGLPVVGTTAGAIPEAVPNSAAMLIEPDDVAALANALRALIADKDARTKIAAAARAAAGKLPSWRDSAKIFASAVEAAT